ncbi:MAG: GNAT family N-acetyltransferase [Anaerolineales bacterium]|nr:GNAT family N-acetyltransferase [Anaerolineales bacterium]
MNYRPYTKADYEKCLEIFRTNTPDFFGTQEEPDFVDFLERLPCQFFVIEIENKIVGCGGFFINEEKRTAALCYGMVARQYHKQGLGKYLLLKRLDAISHDPLAERILLDTSQYSKGFFEKLGFIVYEIIQDGYFAGLHRHEMELKLDDEKRVVIQNELNNLEHIR